MPPRAASSDSFIKKHRFFRDSCVLLKSQETHAASGAARGEKEREREREREREKNRARERIKEEEVVRIGKANMARNGSGGC